MSGFEFGTLERINAMCTILKIALPVSIVHEISRFKKPFAEMHQQIDVELDREGILKSELYKYAEADSVEFYLLDIFQNPDINFKALDFNNSKSTESELILRTKLMRENLIEEIVRVIKTRQLRYYFGLIGNLGRHYPMAGFKISPLLLTVHSDVVVIESIFYSTFSYYQYDLYRKFLLDKIQNISDWFLLTELLKSLSHQKLKEPIIQQILVDHYRKNSAHYENYAIDEFLKCLAQFKNEAAFEMILEILIEVKNTSFSNLVSEIITFGIPPTFLAKKALETLTQNNQYQSEQAASFIEEHAEILYTHPTDNQLMLVTWAEAMEKYDHSEFAHTLSSVVLTRNEKEMLEMLGKIMFHSSRNILHIMSLTIKFVLEANNMPENPLRSEKMIERYRELTQHSSSWLAQNARDILEFIETNADSMRYDNRYYRKTNILVNK